MNSLPRDLPISISATVLPSSDGGGARRARRVGEVSAVGSRSFSTYVPLGVMA